MFEIAGHTVKDVNQRRTPNRSGHMKPRGIVVHDTAGRLEAETSISWLCNPKAKASAHFVVARDGTLTQLAPLNVQTWHAGRSQYRGVKGLNRFTIGIEIVNPGRLTDDSSGFYKASFKKIYSGQDYPIRFVANETHGSGNWMDYTEEQIATVFDLCQAIKAEYPIDFIVPHWEISPGRKFDTSPLFPLRELRSSVFGRQTTPTTRTEVDDADGFTTANVNQRRWPNTRNPNVMGVVKKGTPVDVVRSGVFDGAQWHLCDVNNRRGWIRADFIRLAD